MRLPSFMPRRGIYGRLLLACLVLFAGGCVSGGSADPYSKAYTAREINASPRLLDGTIVKGSNLSGLRLENVVVTNATFYNTYAKGAVFKNVVFENCRFISAVFSEALLDSVVFRGGVMTFDDAAKKTKHGAQFVNSRFHNLVLDGIALENTVFNGSQSSITIRNARRITASRPMITGAGMHLALQDSVFRDIPIAEVVGASTLSATGCTFEYAHFGNSAFAKTTFLRNTTYGPHPLQERNTRARRR